MLYIYIVFTYFASFTGYEDNIFKTISFLHVQGSKIGGKIVQFGKKSNKKIYSAELLEFVFFKSAYRFIRQNNQKELLDILINRPNRTFLQIYQNKLLDKNIRLINHKTKLLDIIIRNKKEIIFLKKYTIYKYIFLDKGYPQISM